jgi:hypothetical protein
MNLYWQQSKIPERLKEAGILPDFKIQDRMHVKIISLLNEGYKLFAKVITGRLQRIAGVILLEKSSFRKGGSHTDNVHVIK